MLGRGATEFVDGAAANEHLEIEEGAIGERIRLEVTPEGDERVLHDVVGDVGGLDVMERELREGEDVGVEKALEGGLVTARAEAERSVPLRSLERGDRWSPP